MTNTTTLNEAITQQVYCTFPNSQPMMTSKLVGTTPPEGPYFPLEACIFSLNAQTVQGLGQAFQQVDTKLNQLQKTANQNFWFSGISLVLIVASIVAVSVSFTRSKKV